MILCVTNDGVFMTLNTSCEYQGGYMGYHIGQHDWMGLVKIAKSGGDAYHL